MIAVGTLGLVAGLGTVGFVIALRARPLPLEAIVAAMNAPLPLAPPGSARALDRLGRCLGRWIEDQPFAVGPRWVVARQHLAITGTTLDRLAVRMVVGAGLGLLAPSLLWLAIAATGTLLPAAWVLVLTLLLVPTAGAVPVLRLRASARARRRHFRVVVGSFTDLVVLELAGGTGIEGALFAASQVSPDWASQRLARTLLAARESGSSSWEAIAGLGYVLGVPQLNELATSVQLGGTEGARIRDSLRARAVALRRHEQADEESAANAVTERLFVPGSLLLVGFLVFVGYPAFARIVGGI